MNAGTIYLSIHMARVPDIIACTSYRAGIVVCDTLENVPTPLLEKPLMYVHCPWVHVWGIMVQEMM